METSHLVIFAFLFFQILGNTMIVSSSNVTCIEKEMQSLLVLKQTLTDTYDLLSTWRGVECCAWQGVECDGQNGHVVKLDLRSTVYLRRSFDDEWKVNIGSDKWLKGELSSSLQYLKHLRYLDLSMNGFLGNIPEFLGSFENLEYLNLSGSGFSGVVPPHLGNLSKLQYLDLKMCFQDRNNHIMSSDVYIMGDLGWVSSLSSLSYLDLSGIKIGKQTDWFYPVNMLPSLLTLNLALCDINIPFIKFINFTSLNSLDLSFNHINSTIPVWLSNLTRPMHLSLQGNQFYGKIPDTLGNLSSLILLDLSRNNFFGQIPMSLWQLRKLKRLDLAANSLVGVLSETHFMMLRSLNYLALSWNLLKLNFSDQWNAPFQLQVFDASSCNIGPHFPKWLQTQRNLERLDLSNSSIRDIIPKWFENILFHILYLDLSNNQISGKLPQVHFGSNNSTWDRILKMNSNKFEGSLATFPSNVKILDLSNNLLSRHLPQIDESMNSSLEDVNLSNNLFTGSIPVHLCKNPSLRILDLSQNKFSGKLPRCLGYLTHLSVIDLANNNITGVVPNSLGSLKHLFSLHLHSNRFEGVIPRSLQNLTKLVTMDLGNNFFVGTIPFWIGEKLSNLIFLNLQSNKLIGNIPIQLCQLNNLQYLSLANNNITGTIPHCFKSLSGMVITNFGHNNYTYRSRYEENILASLKGMELMYTKSIRFLTSLDLSSNNIAGEIPNGLMYLVGLKNLNLSRNLLKGHIPMMIGDLKQLESLDLSMNYLSGQIPQSLTSLNYLSYLNLSFNNLSGQIPFENQLQTLDGPIYEGNNGLCGPPISRSCRGNDVTHNHVDEDEGQDDMKDLWFFPGLGPGFVFGFMGLLGSLYFIKRLRMSFFEMFENVYGWLTVSVLLILARLRRMFSNEDIKPIENVK